MNKVILYFLLVILQVSLFISCTREDDLQTAIEEFDPANAYGTYSEAHWRRVHAAQRQAYIGDLYRSYGVGYGYNGTGKYSDYDEVRDRVIDLSVIQKFDEEHGSATIVDDISPSSFHHVYSGTDAMSICKKLTEKASVKTNLLLFQHEVTTTYSTVDLMSNEYAFCTIYDGLTVASRHMEPYDLYYIAHEHPEVLSPGFRRYQQLAADAYKKNNLTEAMRILQNMMQTYGTHVIYHANLGGKLKFTTQMNRHVVDSRNTVDEQASASFLYCVGGTEGTDKQNWVVNTSEQRDTHIEALGGNSALATKLAGMHDSDNMADKNNIVDEWFKSLKFNPAGDKDDNNVELIEIKVAPISDLILDHEIASLYYTMIGKVVTFETNVLPRVMNKVYARIPASVLKQNDRSTTKQLVAQDEIVGEVLNEFVHNAEYTVFYPTLNGRISREGIGRRISDDSLFTITWQYYDGAESQAKAQVTPLARLNYDGNIYYNNGDIDTAPSGDATSYTDDVVVRQAAIYMWNDTCTSNMKIGPYYLQQGVMANTSTDNSAMNTVRTLLKDVPVGYELADTAKVNEIVRFMYYSGQVFDPGRIFWDEVPPFFTYKRFILLDKEKSRYSIFWLEPKNPFVTPIKGQQIGQALLVRRKDFKFM